MRRREFLASGAAAVAVAPSTAIAAVNERHLLFIAEPGIRNYVSYGGVGVLVYDIGQGHRFVKRIPTWSVAAGAEPENVKGIAASASTKRLYVSTTKRVGCLDLIGEKMVWDRTFEGGCDRLAISPDGRLLYVPSLEGPHWNVVRAASGEVIARIVTNSGAHNTVYGQDGSRVYLAGLRSPVLSVADPRTHAVVKTIGPFSNFVRPFTVNAAQTLCYVNVNELLGFEIGDLETGKKLHRVEVQGYQKGPVDRHGCPSHGVGLTPDETELWLSDGHNSAMHVFDNTVMPPRQLTTLKLRDQPGWITFSIDGQYAYPSTGEVFETRSKKKVIALADETGRQIGSEKLLELVFNGKTPIRAGDQFGLGSRTARRRT
jgi:DNA-binding beta-propeller fold protein YncE